MNDFDKKRRLLHQREYTYVFQDAKKTVTPYFIVLYRNNIVGHARLGLALSKKMIAKAHHRNRIKRIIRETFRTHSMLSSVDMIVLAKPGLDKITNSMIHILLGQVCDKLSV